MRRFIQRVTRALKELQGNRPEDGRIVRYESRYDGYRSYFADSLDPTKLKHLVRAGDAGDLATTLQLFEEFEEKDPHLCSVARTRRIALTGLDWEVVSAAEGQEELPEKNLADEAADHVREVFTNLKSFEGFLEHLSKAIGPNLVVAELVWQGGKLIDITPVPSWRLTTETSKHQNVETSKPEDDAGLRVRVSVITGAEPRGVPAESPKFVVHVPSTEGLFPFKSSLTRCQAGIWLVKFYALTDWALFCQTFGMPIRWGKYRPGASNAEKTELQTMLSSLGSHAWAMVSEAVQLEFVEATNRGVSPYEAIINWCDRKQSVLWLGGHLMVDTTGATGTHAAGTVQENVRDDLRDDDIRRESRTIRSQLIEPLVRWAFPGRDAPLPKFKRIKPDVVDYMALGQLIELATQRIGLPVSKRWVYQALAIPEPKTNELGVIEEPTVARIETNPLEVRWVFRDALESVNVDKAQSLLKAGLGTFVCTLTGRGGAAAKTLTIRNVRWTGLDIQKGQGYCDFILTGEAQWRSGPTASPAPAPRGP